MHFLTLKQLSLQDVQKIIFTAIQIKKNKKKYKNLFKNKTFGLLFEKPSTRTKVAFEVGIQQMSGKVVNLAYEQMQMQRGEEWDDTIRILSLYLDGLVIRNTNHSLQEKAASISKIPIINALSNQFHPSQILADFMTIYENFHTFQKSICFLGDGGSNIAHSLIIACTILKVNLYIACPEQFFPNPYVIKYVKEYSQLISISSDIDSMVKNCDILYTDVWTSLGKESKEKERNKILRKYQLNREVVQKAKENCKIMHCLPAHKGSEITKDVFNSKNSIIFEQAENKLYIQKAILAFLYNK